MIKNFLDPQKGKRNNQNNNNKYQMSKKLQQTQKKNIGKKYFIFFSTLEELIFKLNDEDHSEDEGI